MKKRINRLILGLACAILMFTAPLYAEEYICIGSLGALTLDNLRVPQGATCTLDKTNVEGNIKVESKSTLRAYEVRVIGNVQAENAAQVEVLPDSTVGGSIQIKQGGGAYIDRVNINGDLQFDDNKKSLVANKNTIGGNLQAFQNKGGLSITGNKIDGNLQCKENQPAPTGGGNIVNGNKEDQCANLSPGGNPGGNPSYTEDDLLGAWNTYSKAKMKVSRIGSRSFSNNSSMVFKQNGTFALTEIEQTQTYIYSGHWRLIKGKKILLDLDIAGQSEFIRMWTNWLEEIASRKGISITGINFSETSFKISQPSISKKKNKPRKATITAKGWISASENGRDIKRKFSYKNTVSFLD